MDRVAPNSNHWTRMSLVLHYITTGPVEATRIWVGNFYCVNKVNKRVNKSFVSRKILVGQVPILPHPAPPALYYFRNVN